MKGQVQWKLKQWEQNILQLPASVQENVYCCLSHRQVLWVSHAQNIFLCPKQSVAKCQSPALPRPEATSHHNPVVLYYCSSEKFICAWMSESFKRRYLK